MKDCKRLIAGFYVTGTQGSTCGGQPLERSLAQVGADACRRGADQLWVMDGSQDDEEHEYVIGQMKELAKEADEPIFAGGTHKTAGRCEKISLCRGQRRFFGRPDSGECGSDF